MMCHVKFFGKKHSDCEEKMLIRLAKELFPNRDVKEIYATMLLDKMHLKFLFNDETVVEVKTIKRQDDKKKYEYCIGNTCKVK